MDVYTGLFVSAFLSATILPGTSEVLLAGLQTQGYDTLSLWLWATTGNVLGSFVNWLLGGYFLHFENRRWFPFRHDQLQRAQQWFQKYGVWSLLLAWAPLIGDALTFIAGVMKVRPLLFLLLVTLGKGLRYALILGFISGLMM